MTISEDAIAYAFKVRSGNAEFLCKKILELVTLKEERGETVEWLAVRCVELGIMMGVTQGVQDMLAINDAIKARMG